MKKTTTTNIEAIIAELAKNHKNMKEQIASVRVTLDAMEAESEKMQSALEKAMVELMKAKEDESKKKPSKLWKITYTFHGKTKEFWCARDIYNALGGKTINGFCEMVDGLRRGDCVQLRRDIIKVSGCPEYFGDSLSYWMDEVAVDEATEWMAAKEKKLGNRKFAYKDYDIRELIKTYEETRSAAKTAKVFGISAQAVVNALHNEGVKLRQRGVRSDATQITEEIEAEICRLAEDGLTQREIADRVHVNQHTVGRVMRRNGIIRKARCNAH